MPGKKDLDTTRCSSTEPSPSSAPSVDRFAPLGAIWVCGACGKTALDRYGMEGPRSTGWDESCMMNAVLCARDGIEPGQRVTKAEPFAPKDNGND